MNRPLGKGSVEKYNRYSKITQLHARGAECRLSPCHLCSPARLHPPDDRASTPQRSPAATAQPPATAAARCPTCGAPIVSSCGYGPPPTAVSYKLRGRTVPGRSWFHAVCTPNGTRAPQPAFGRTRRLRTERNRLPASWIRVSGLL